MRVSWNWLAEFVELEWSVSAVAERLTMAGLEVEGIERTGADLLPIRIAEVREVQPHPQATKLQVCRVDAGEGTLRTVVCGAPNVAVGMRVPFAPAGARLPDGRELSATEIRGVHSEGMLCSEAELGLGPDDSGLLALAADAPVGESLGGWIGAEDHVLEISITPNRGDCLSVLGIAREVAALTGQRRRAEGRRLEESSTATAEAFRVRIDAPDGCGRYLGRLVSGLRVAPSPLWLQTRLRHAGLRPLNNVVDVTNYVLLERGQPLHAFDAERLAEPALVVRRAQAGEQFAGLDGSTHELAAEDLVIACGNGPVALAGILGGSGSEVVDATSTIFLEAAWFVPSGVRRTSRRLGLRTESSYRFERAVDVEGVPAAIDRAAELLASLAGGSVAMGRLDLYPAATSPRAIPLRLPRVHALLGMDLSSTQVTDTLTGLGMRVTEAGQEVLDVLAPSWRTDVEREIDLVEEIVRVIGYENVPTTLPVAEIGGEGLRAADRLDRRLRTRLADLGLREIVPLSFASASANEWLPGLHPNRRAVVLRNPLSTDLAEMRRSLASSLLTTLRHNLAQGAEQLALFLLGKVFWEEGEYGEATHVAAVVGPGFAHRGIGARTLATSFADFRGVVEQVLETVGASDVSWRPQGEWPGFHPGKTAGLWWRDEFLGLAGAVHPDVLDHFDLPDPCWLFELDLGRFRETKPAEAKFADFSRFPAARRDLALVVGRDFAADAVLQFIRTWEPGAGWIEEAEVFDEYVGAPLPPDQRSLTFSVSYRLPDRTLTDTEVNERHEDLRRAIVAALPVQGR